jgi:hypothetical protein
VLPERGLWQRKTKKNYFRKEGVYYEEIYGLYE